MRLSAGLLVIAIGACSDGGNVTGSADAPSADAPVNPLIDAPGPRPDANMNLLSQAGLYSDFGARTIAPGLTEFTPSFPLWSDALVKRRWIRLPPGGQVDSSDMDHWKFPVGTQLWKEFALANGTILETRLIERIGDADYRFGAYVWNDTQTEAVYMTGGMMNVLGTDHDVPTVSECVNCHVGEQGRILGFSAIQVTPNPPAGIGFTNPPRAQGYKPSWSAPLAYLHANCGNCHNPNGSASSANDMLLRISVAEVDGAPEATAMYAKIFNVATMSYHVGGDCGLAGLKWRRIAPMDLACSAIYVRMIERGNSDQMPPIATKHPDMTAVDAVGAWIRTL